MKFIRFLKTDIKIINSYFLIILVLLILVCVGYTSYALFSISKTSNNIIELEVGEISTTGADTLIKLTGNKDNSGLYTITHPKDTTLQIGNDKDITEYRYRGASPKNYVKFNNETWRIIGIFPTDDGTGKIENRIKIVRNESIGEQVWSSKTSTNRTNDWTTARLKSYLNEGITIGSYQNTLLNSSRDMIDNVKYYLGGYTTADIMKDVMYQYERKISGSDYYYGTNPNSWVGKIALMYASDYGYASSEECVKTLFNCQSCAGNNWLSNNTNSWLLPQSTNSNAGVFHMKGTYITHYNGSDNYNSNQPLMVFPTLYLKPNVQIMDGDGTSTNPYVFALDGKVVLPTIDKFEIFETTFNISVTEGTYPLDKYCILSNDSDSANCTWQDIPSNEFSTSCCCWNISLTKGKSYTFYLFVKDENSNVVTKTYEYSVISTPAPCPPCI